MKKVIKLILTILIIFIILELLFTIFKKNHQVNYSINVDNKTFNIEETFKNNQYYLKITNDDYIFSYIVPNKYYKSKKILSNLKIHTIKDMMCIYPLDIDNVNITCSINKNTYSYEYLKKDLNDFVNELIDENINNPSWDNKTSTTLKKDNVTIYKDNIYDDTYLYLWNYKGFYTINKDNINKLDIIKYDTYVNDLGILIDKYYVIPDYDEKLEFTKLLVYDITTNKKKTIKLKNKISRDTYINGVVDNKLYIFDRDNLIQYEINPKKRTIKEVGNKEDDCFFYTNTYDKTYIKLSVYDFRDKFIEFTNEYNELDSIIDVTKLKFIEKYMDVYYFYDGKTFYRYDFITNNKISLFEKENINNIIMTKDDIYFRDYDTIYMYNINTGLKNILTYQELVFNPKNRLAVYKK